MAGLIKLQSDFVRTGDKAYQFVAENGMAYLTQNVSGNFARVGFGFHYRAADWTEQPSYGAETRQNRMMTSATTPAPSRVTVSSEHVVYPGWKAFNGDSSTGWWTSGEPQWLAYDHGSPMPVSRYKLRAFTEGTFKSHIPNNFELQGSTDGVNWVTVDTQTNRNPTVNNTPSTSANDMTITMAQTYVYRHWRLYVTDTPSNSVGTGDLELWGGAITIPVLPIAQVCAADGAVRATLQLDSQTHHLQVVNSVGTLLAETTRAFEPDNWYYLEWSHGLIGGELRFNGVTEITWSNTVATVEQLRLGLVTTKTAGFFMDDIIVSSGTDWPGPVRCHLLQPNEDIEETGWSRLPADAPTAHSTLTDGDDASYLYSQQGVIRVGLEDLPDPNEILAVQVMSRLSVDAEGQTDVDLLLDETIVDTQTLTTTPTWYTHIVPVNPATDAAWTAEEVNALDVGWMMVVVPDAPANLAVLQGEPGVAATPKQNKVRPMTSSSAPSPQVAAHSS
ncbi:MAG: discoidin domain-containing protein, partial [Caldilineaceae bacterium]|nr:discoidin domain-containing protein [Caldilineaceae bacterium]